MRLLLGIGTGMRLALRVVAAVAVGAVAVFWTKITMSFNTPILTQLIAEGRSYGFGKTPGIITRSSLEETPKGAAIPAVRYEYRVGDSRFSGADIPIEKPGKLPWSSPHSVTERYLVGTEVTVSYDPVDPAHSVLEPGFSGESLGRLLLQLPFNLVALGFWSTVIRLLCPVREKAFPAGEPVSRGGAGLRVRMPQSRPIFSALMSLFFTSLAVTLLMAFLAPSSPPVALACLAWLITLGRPVMVLLRLRRRIASGAEDLVIDQDAQTIALPCTFGREAADPLAFTEVERVGVLEVVQTDGEGSRAYQYAAVLRVSRHRREERLFLWKDPRCAAEFAQWLGGHLHKSVRLPKRLYGSSIQI
jgi:hypothetical protein